MAQIPPDQSIPAQIVQREIEDTGQAASRPGESSPNPPSTDLPDSVRLEAPFPPPIPKTGRVPFFDPVTAPIAALAGRTVNKTAPNLSVNLTEKDINTAAGGKPHTPNVIATDGTQIITNDQPDDADHLP